MLKRKLPTILNITVGKRSLVIFPEKKMKLVTTRVTLMTTSSQHLLSEEETIVNVKEYVGNTIDSQDLLRELQV